MTQVADLPADLAIRLSGCDLIVFDGECVFCSGFFRFILRHDRKGGFHFATAQSPLGQRLYAALDLPTDDFETNLIVVDGVVYQRLDAFAAAMSRLDLPWRWAAVCRLLPGPLKDAIYKPIARNRYRIWGRRNACILPDAATLARFLPGGT